MEKIPEKNSSGKHDNSPGVESLTDRHLADLAKSGLTAEDAQRYGIRSATRKETRHILGFDPGSDGLLFASSSLNGGTPSYQFKPDEPFLDENGKPIKYLSPRGGTNHLQVPEDLLESGLLQDPSVPLVVTEGRKKSLATTKAGFPCLSLSGVWCFRGKDPDTGKSRSIPDLDHITWEGRIVYICYDSDLVDKPVVQAAECALAEELHRRGAVVKMIRLPGGEQGEKVGLDDFLMAQGAEALARLIAEAEEPQPPRTKDRPVRKSQATLLVELAAPLELWHTPGADSEAYAEIPVAKHKETWPLNSKAFRRWLKKQFHEKYCTAPSSQAVQDALGVLEGKALFDGPEHPVYVRLAEHEGAIYLDLANEAWEAVEITSTRWRVITDLPVKFRRSRGMLSLPHPVAGGSLEPLRRLCNMANGEDWCLAVGWLVQALRPKGPYPVMVLHGEQGSAKSTTARMLRDLIDPNTASLRTEPRDARDLIIAGTNGWVVSLDNMSHIQPWLSDALCRLATGGGFATRELYSDAGEILFEAQRPIILNGIEELATRGDLLDRAIILYLPTIPEEQRRPEAEVWRDFWAVQPGLLGGLLNAVSMAQANLPTTKLAKLPRMADFALWVAAAEPALNWPIGDFLTSYMGNREAANELAIEAALIVAPLRGLLTANGTSWEGTATDLLHDLNAHADERTRKAQGWPSNGRSASNALRRVAPNLRRAGVDVTFQPRKNRKRLITIAMSSQQCEQAGNNASLPSPSTPTLEKQGPTGDTNRLSGDDGVTQPLTPADHSPASLWEQGDEGDANNAIEEEEFGDLLDGRI